MHQILCTLTMGLLPSLTVRFWRGSQVFSSTGYPNHFTKYFTPRPTFLTSRIASTSYSKWSSSIVAGGGGGGFWEGKEGGRYGVNNNSLKTRWIRHARGSLSRYPAGPTFSSIVKGPVRLLSSFLEGRSIFKFRVSIQTKSPLEYSRLGCLPTS